MRRERDDFRRALLQAHDASDGLQVRDGRIEATFLGGCSLAPLTSLSYGPVQIGLERRR